MKFVYYSVVLNHHQAHLADELARRLGDDFRFVELKSSEGESKGDIQDFSNRPYLLQAWKNDRNFNAAMALAKSADVCVFASNESLPFQIERMKLGLLSFEMSERWLKKGVWSILSPRLLRNLYNHYLFSWEKKPLYKLCCSAFAANDQYFMHTFLGKCFKWGYFTRIENFDIVNCIKNKSTDVFTIMWCSRFVDFKHPEIPVKLAYQMKNSGLKFHIDMFGDGYLRPKIEAITAKLDLIDVISFKGSVNNEIVRQEMRQHHMFLFTSDKREGWGVVANEAMSNGCLLVAANEIGSIPFLVKDMKTGIIYQNGNVEDLYKRIHEVIYNPSLMSSIILNAFDYMRDIWSPSRAVSNLLSLSEALLENVDFKIESGPCSLATPI